MDINEMSRHFFGTVEFPVEGLEKLSGKITSINPSDYLYNKQATAIRVFEREQTFYLTYYERFNSFILIEYEGKHLVCEVCIDERRISPSIRNWLIEKNKGVG
jgi:hypothetical protein